MNISPEKATWFLFIQGDLNVFSSLFKGYYPLLHNYGYKITADVALTEDCLQDFFLYLYEHRKNLGEVDHVKSYLFVSFRRAIFKKLKEKRKFIFIDDSYEASADFEFSAEELTIQKEFNLIQKSALALLLNQLSAREKEVIYLKYQSALNTKEIAAVMNISYQSVLNTLQKAFVKLRNTVENDTIRAILKEL
jgi:RNA polymerase sigma factor (sigma-70 family)